MTEDLQLRELLMPAQGKVSQADCWSKRYSRVLGQLVEPQAWMMQALQVSMARLAWAQP